jgi:hypothetical protein
MKRSRLRAVVAALGLAGCMLGLATTPAFAATTSAAVSPAKAASHAHAAPAVPSARLAPAAAPANCPAGATCGYTGENYTGSEGILYGDNSNLTGSGSIWESIESVWNHGNSCNVVLYHNTGYNPDSGSYTLNRGHGLADIASVNEGLWHHTYSNLWVGCS